MAGVEEVAADVDHHVHGAALDQLLPHFGLVATGARRLRGHDDAGAAVLVQVAVEIGKPEVVGVRDLLRLVDAGQAEGQALVALDLLGVHFVHVEGRIGHHEIALSDQLVRVLVVGDGLVAGADPALQPVHGEVDLGQLRGGFVLLVAVERDPLHRVLAGVLDEVARLHEHAARAARGVENDAMVRLDHVHDGLDDRGRREELAVVVRALLGELGQEVFVDAAEHVAGSRAQGFGIEGPHHLFQHVVLEALVVLRQLAGKRREVVLQGFHGGGHGRAEIAVLRHLQQHVVACRLGQHQGAAPSEIGLDQGSVRHPARGLVFFDRGHRPVVAVRRVPQEDEAQNGHEVLVRREVRVGTQVVRNLPEVRLEPFNADQVVRDHSLVLHAAHVEKVNLRGAHQASHSWPLTR